MALNLDTAIRISANVQGGNQVQSFVRDLRGLEGAAKISTADLGRMNIAINRMAREAGNTTVGLRQHIIALQSLRDRVDINSNAYKRLGNEIEGLRGKLRGLDGDAKRAADSLQQTGTAGMRSQLRGAFGGALGALATGGGVQGAVGALAGGMAASGGVAGLGAAAGVSAVAGIGALAIRVGVDAETAQIKLKALTDQFGEYNAAQEAAARIAKTLRISTTEAQDGFSKLYGALRPTGITLQEIEDAFVGFTAAARASGATATESSAALLQLKQALGSGVLQGDELRSIREQAPAVGQAIAKEMGVTVGELKKLGSEGKITTDIVIRALAKLKGEKLDQLNAQFNTSAQAIKDLQIATEDFGRTVARTFGPTTVGLLRIFTAGLKQVADQAEDVSNALTRSPASAAEQAIRAGRLPNALFGGMSGAEQLFLGTSGAGGVGLTGLRQEAQELARIRRQPANQVLLELMQNRLNRVNTAPDSSSTSQAARDAAAADRQAGRDRAAAANEQASQKAADNARREQEKAQKEQEKAQQDQLDFQNELSKIKLDAEKRLMDYRVQALERVQQIERDMANERKQAELDTQEIKTQIIQQQQVNALQQQRAELQNLGRDTSLVDQAIERLQAAHELDNQLFRNRITLEDRRMQIEQKVADYQTNTAKEIRQITIDAAEQYQNRIQQGIAGANFSSNNTSRANALVAAANKLGVNPVDLGTIIGFETGGTYDPSKWGGAGGNYMGLIQFGAPERRMYGAYQGQSFEEQVLGPVVRYFQDRFAGVGMSTRGADLLTLYRTVLGGNPKASLTGRDAFGTSPSSGVAMMAPHRAETIRRFFTPTAPVLPPANNIQPLKPLQPQNPELLQVPGVQQVKNSAAQLLKAEEERRKILDIQAQQQYQSGFVTQYAQVTNQLDAQGKQIKEQFEDYQKTLQLQRTGLSPELAQQRVQLERMSQIEIKLLEAQKRDIEAELKKTTLTGNQVKENEANLKLVTDRLANQRQLVDSMIKEAAAQESLQRKYEQYKSLIDNTANAIGNGLGSAMDLLIEGTDNWGNSLREIASGVLVDIAKQLTQTMVVQPAVTGIQSILGSLIPAIGGASSGFGLEYAAPAFANGGIMTDAGPLPLRTYAKGGIANSPQLALFGEGRRPEAYVPLPDGRTIPVTMRGGGGVNVSVNVDARGSSVEGSGNNANALGRAIAASVQAELIRQKRPGGLLA